MRTDPMFNLKTKNKLSKETKGAVKKWRINFSS